MTTPTTITKSKVKKIKKNYNFFIFNKDMDSIYNSNKNEIISDNKSENKTKLINDFNNNEHLIKSDNERQSGSTVKSGNTPRNNNITQFEDGFGKKMMNLDMNNDDADDIFDMFKDNNVMKK